MKLTDVDRERDLRKLAAALGCSLNSTYTQNGKHLEEELVRRIIDAIRSVRESRLWMFALLSAIASLLSALAAWFAILKM